MKARISILMPFDNEAPFIAEAIGSVLQQTEQAFELIAIDDGSTDGSAEIVASFNDSRIVLLQPGKLGKNAALNLGFLTSSAPVITFFCADDTLPATSLENKLKTLHAVDVATTPAMAYGKARLMSADKNFDGLIVPRNPNRGSDSASAQAFTRPLANLIFPLPHELPNEDQWSALCARIFAKEIFHLPVIVWNYRIHAFNSHNRYLDFEKYSRQYHARFCVYAVFLKKFETQLKPEQKKWLKVHAQLEEHRYTGALFAILTTRISLKERLRALLYASPRLFSLRRRFYRFFSGW